MDTISRRGFAGLFGSGLAAAALPALGRAHTRAHPKPKPKAKPQPAEPIRLSANENPFGACPAALEAMREACGRAWRYPDEAVDALRADIAALHGVPPEWVLVGDGSSEILKVAASAYTGPGKRLTMADPTFEAAGAYAEAIGAPVSRIVVDAAYAHPIERMAPPDAGLAYVCNPNNPTGSVTPKARLRAFLDSAQCMTLVDEAYHHYADSADYESVAPLVNTHPRLIVARTFSKIYGLAGARLGYAIAQKAVIEKLSAQAAWDSVNIFAIAGARASLADKSWAAQGQKRNAATRAHVVSTLAKKGFKSIPSHTNFVMIELHRDVKPLIDALAARGIQVGRRFPALPTHLRVTLGTPQQMDRFLAEFLKLAA